MPLESGQSSYSYTSSEVPVAPVVKVPHPEHKYYMAAGMDIDGDEEVTVDDPVPMDVNETIEVVPGVHVHVGTRIQWDYYIYFSYHCSLYNLQDVPLTTWLKCQDNY